MELITSGETLEFLSKSAPRAWVKRMLLWMIFVDELAAFSLEGRSVAKARAFSIILDVLKQDGFGPGREELIREHFDAELAERLISAKETDEFEEIVHEWKLGGEPEQVLCGYFVFAENVNWEEGIVQATIYGGGQKDSSLFSDEEPLLASEFRDAEFAVTLKGLCFERDKIEMLQPNVDLQQPAKERRDERPRLGRPRTWDWEGATAHLLAFAQKPDGLPIGAGAQAQIERLIADWFMASTGNTPAVSQVRQHANKIIKALGNASR